MIGTEGFFAIFSTANGFPPPKVFWTDTDGNVVRMNGEKEKHILRERGIMTFDGF